MNEVKKTSSKFPAIKTNLLDKTLEWFSPERAVKRLRARTTMALVGGYNAGDRSRPANRSSRRSLGSANADILPSLENIRSESRDLLRNAPLARGAVNTVVTNVVGTGLNAHPSLDRDVLKELAGLTDENIDKIEKAFERHFNTWAKSRACDASMRSTFTGLQKLTCRSALESGDVFPLRRMIDRPGRELTTSIQIIEADRVQNPRDSMIDKAMLHAGIERDVYGAAIRYHVTKTHPGDNWNGLTSKETVAVEAFSETGDWQMLQVMIVERPEQSRGVPYLAPIVEILKQLTRYTDAEIANAVISGMFTAFVTSDGGTGFDGDPELAGSTTGAQLNEIKMGNASIVDLAPGEKVEFANPARPNQAFDPFVQAILRQIGVALEIPFEILIKHFTASYSAAQAAIVEAWKFFTSMRVWLVDQFCQPVYEAVISEIVARGIVEAPGFFTAPDVRAAYLQADWVGPPRGMIDQNKEANANATMEDRGWKTGRQIVAEMTGGSWNKNHDRRVKEKTLRAEAGLLNKSEAAAAVDQSTSESISSETNSDLENE